MEDDLLRRNVPEIFIGFNFQAFHTHWAFFSQLSTFEVQEDDVTMSLTSLFYDRQIPSLQAVPSTNVYIHVNSDEADHLMVDPAYRLERFKEAHERLYALYSAYQEVDRQLYEGNPAL